jgi:hypothetical protein
MPSPIGRRNIGLKQGSQVEWMTSLRERKSMIAVTQAGSSHPRRDLGWHAVETGRICFSRIDEECYVVNRKIISLANFSGRMMAKADAAAGAGPHRFGPPRLCCRDSMSLVCFSLAAKRYQMRLCSLPPHIERLQEITSSSAGEGACRSTTPKNAPRRVRLKIHGQGGVSV